ncbi:serine/threonine-protein kinase [Puerhibacterium puerhi]|uniref:serine/threonine-protein kinase n=1 Tax=Puerhibacterium puerhi TaxID=2692623 RepID=UPI00135BD863|nr:serine/threonine-protein kinase [Puerhibacterium puerhi]
MGEGEGGAGPAEQPAATPPARLSTGAEVGGYTIRSLLGRGAMGAVYEAADGGGHLVALKILHAHLDADPVGRERLRREVLALQRLRHPAVAQVLDAELDGPEAFVVTDLYEGPTLEREIDQGGPLDAVDLYELADQLAGALEAVHLAGVVHRDLKPSNVLITPNGPVLIDFGIAQALEEPRAALTSPGFVIGTPGYLAPELLDGGAPTPESDWWSWAALLAFAATGRSPFGVRPTDQVLRRSREGRADLVGLPARTARALAGALQADPATRWGPTEVARALRRDADDASHAAILAGDPLAGDDEATQRIAAHDDPTQPLGAPTRLLGAPTQLVAPPSIPPATSADARATAIDRDRAAAHDGLTQAVPLGSVRPVTGPIPQVEARYQPYEALPDAPEPEEPAPAVPYARPATRRRTGSLLAAVAPLAALAATRPGVAFAVLVGLLLLCRVVGTAWDRWHARRERNGGPRGSDGVLAAVALPWHVLLGVLGAIPQVVVSACTAVVVVVGGWWLFGAGRVVVLPRVDVEARSVGGMNETLVFCGVLAAAMVLAALAAWFGPAGRPARLGGRVLLGRLAPGRVGAAVFVVVCLVLAGVLAAPALGAAPQIDWWPLPGPPEIA